ncbi:MAG: phosphohistidine phosphatase SixA [Blastocatellia bacterium]
MIELYLMRHGIAAAAGESGVATDAERELSAVGRARLQQEAAGIRELGLKPDLILSSPLRRCQQTSEIVANRLGLQHRTRVLEALAPGRAFANGEGAHAEIFIELGAWQFERALLVGHQPDLAEISSYLLAGNRNLNLDFRKGSICAIELASLPPRGPGLLRWMMAPRQLRMLARTR